MFDTIPRELKPIKQWVLWRRDGERKAPVNPFTLGNAGVQWRNTWGTFKEVSESLRRHPGKVAGIGFVLTSSDPFVCVDLDDCFAFGTLNPFASAVVETLNGYTEYSPSGKGLHIWIRAAQTERNIKRKGIEIYSFDRWMTVTGKPLESHDLAKIPERESELQHIIDQLPKEPTESRQGAPESAGAQTERKAMYLPIADDTELWTRLFNGKNGHIFRSLYAGDTSVCFNDESRAVIFLANRLAVMTDFDEGRIKRLLYQTGLVSDKWESRRGGQTWLDGRIQDAINYMSRRTR